SLFHWALFPSFHFQFLLLIPPDTPRNISCIYYFDAELTCTWTSGRETNFRTNYTLYRKMTMGSCQSKTESCSFYYPDTPYSSSFCFQVKAENILGEASSGCVPIPMEKIEKFEPPEILSVKKITGIKQLLTVTWKMPEKIIPSQDLICQVRYRNLYSNSSVSYINFLPNKMGSCNLTGLWDSTEYSVAIRCISVVSKFWSEWSRGKKASTEEKAPSERVDLWRVIESSHPAGSRYVHLMWKVYALSPLNNFPPSGRILGYKIQYFPENNAALKMTNISSNEKVILLLNEEAYIISVTAYNSAGNSPEAVLRIPSADERCKISQCFDTLLSLEKKKKEKKKNLPDICLSSVIAEAKLY
uniref:Fibronectin type-III domain-containing protein n=1 Tax=Strigops habroptila TaxID=2489341 RepID=A0A672TM96_STRHB